MGAYIIHELLFKTPGVHKRVNWPLHRGSPLNVVVDLHDCIEPKSFAALDETSAISRPTKLPAARANLGVPVLSWGCTKINSKHGNVRGHNT